MGDRMKNGMFIKMCARRIIDKSHTINSSGGGEKTESEIVLIENGQFTYCGLTACFINDMISQMEYYRLRGKRAIPFVKASKEQFNIWEAYFKQPSYNSEELYEKISSKGKNCNIFYLENIYSPDILKKYCQLYNKYCELNDSTKEYIENEFCNLQMKNKKILGVLVRGTDYTRLKPAGHPVQPNIEKIIKKVEYQMKMGKYNAIYLATEESCVYRIFCEKFGKEKILINKRQWYDEVYNELGNELVDKIHFQRENDDYLKGLEYLSSIILLSKCNGLVAGMSGGTFMALCFNNLAYDYKYIFDLGFYK